MLFLEQGRRRERPEERDATPEQDARNHTTEAAHSRGSKVGYGRTARHTAQPDQRTRKRYALNYLHFIGGGGVSCFERCARSFALFSRGGYSWL